jgi:pimeloyl-ACP methyl ester carboxylesterase
VGWSWGAMLALSFAVAHPELVQAIVLVGCGTYDETTRAEYEHRLTAKLGARGVHVMKALATLLDTTSGDVARDKIVAARGEQAEKAQSYELLTVLPEEPPATVDARGHQETWADVLRLQAEGIEPAAFTAIAAPVLMLHGDEDPHPGLATFELLHRYIAQLEYFGLDRCGHTPWKERRARTQFFDALCVWLHTHA